MAHLGSLCICNGCGSLAISGSALMIRVLARTFIVLGLPLFALAQQGHAETLEYPAPARGAAVDDYHGTRVPDPYRGLEDLDSPATRAWVGAEAPLTDRDRK